MSDEILRRLSDQDKLLAKIDARGEGQDKTLSNIEKRLDSHAGRVRDLEIWRWKASGVFIALMFAQEKVKKTLGL